MNSQQSQSDGCVGFSLVLAFAFIVFIAFAIHPVVGIFASIGIVFFVIYAIYTALDAQRKSADSSQTQEFSVEYYQNLDKQIDELLVFLKRLDSDSKFHKHTNDLDNVNISLSGGTFGKLDPNSFEGKLQLLALVDFTRSLLYSGHKLDLNTKECVGILLMTLKLYGTDIAAETVSLVERLADSIEDILKQLLKLPEPEERFILTHLIGDYNADYKLQYHILMYRYISLIVKCDGVVNQQESDWMDEIMQSGKSEVHASASERLSINVVSNPIAELNSLIGLDSVKNEISKLANLVKIQQYRKKNGMKVTMPSYHCVFTGNPGTGKTTVARIVSEIYKDFGLLKKGHLVETDRSGLVAEYVGQTAVKTNKIIDEALDGVLFIDEAYTLAVDSKNDFGAEAIVTLLKRMEDDRDRLVVILAGYSQEMQKFINPNPGLRSRFNRYIDFPDYSAQELLEIFKLRVKQFEYVLPEQTEKVVFNLFSKAVANKWQGFGNGRFARNVFDKTIELQSTRLSQQNNLNVEKLSTILPEDVSE